MEFALSSFPQAFQPLIVIVGDRRETRPKTSGDLLAYSASAIDHLYLANLRLPTDTLIVSDKVILIERPEVLKDQFAKFNILTIGSPAVNLFSRKINDQSLFRFDIDSAAKEQMARQFAIVDRYKLDRYALSVYKAIVEYGARSADDIVRISFRDQNVPDERVHRLFEEIFRLVEDSGLESYRELLRKHEGRAILDCVKSNELDPSQCRPKGEVIADHNDFGLVSIARHPFVDNDEKVVIYVAGRHGPGTAHGVRMLAANDIWAGRELGGIYEVQLSPFESFSNRLQGATRVWETDTYDEHDFSLHALESGPYELDSCFISYSSEDEDFANRIHDDLRKMGVRCWFAPKDIKAGKKINRQIKDAIDSHDRILLILSEHSMNSNWVEAEIRMARKREMSQERQIMFPIRLVEYDLLREWTLFDADEGCDLAAEVREYFIPDFTQWQDTDAYFDTLSQLVSALREK